MSRRCSRASKKTRSAAACWSHKESRMAKWIYRPVVEGNASRQAHADLPAGHVERELGKEGFFGPATHMIHPRPPTGWTSWEGPLRPRAFDLAKLRGGASPWDAHTIVHNPHVRMRWWIAERPMDVLARNADGDELLFLHGGTAELYCDYGHLTISAGDYVMLPRGTMWRVECEAPIALLLIEANNSHYQLPDKEIGRAHV